jgi:hypothetical protein
MHNLIIEECEERGKDNSKLKTMIPKRVRNGG